MRRAYLLLAILLVSVPASGQPDRVPAQQKGYFHPQFVADGEGNLGMLWTRPVAGGHDLFLARRQANGSLVDPVRVNSTPGDVLYLPHREGRPGIASGPGGRVGVSWFDRTGQLHVAISQDRGRSFGPAIAVATGHARPEHAFSDVAFDATGTLFVTWIDATAAPVGQEEPAQLFVARVDDTGRQQVANLTGEYTESICGCCRPDLSIFGRDLTIGFRMVDDGYRDIHRIRLGAGLAPAPPERMGPAMWKIDGCPMAGPAVTRELIWFVDGSRGARRLMEASSPTADPIPIPVATVADAAAPSVVQGSEGPRWMLYLPGSAAGQVLAREAAGWSVVLDDVPPYCTDVVYVEGQLLLVGEKGGTLWMQAHGID